MSRTVIGMCMAAAFGAATLAAQSTTATSTAQTQDRTMSKSSDGLSVTGCLQKDATGGFVLSNAQIDAADKTSSSYGSTGTTGTTGSAAATTATAMAATWKLDGSASDLEEHVGHKIQVSGKEKMTKEAPDATTGTTGTTGATAAMDHSRSLDVKSVKMIAASCS
jgi:hypothetical protein